MQLSGRTRRQFCLSGGLMLGGALVIAGATMPWLTLYAGLQTYSGVIGINGWITVGAGTVALIAGMIASCTTLRWIDWASSVFGAVLFAFALWLVVGLFETLHRQSLTMFVPRAGPGLFVILLGAVLIVVSPIVRRTFASR